jgi:hypothetical protein
MNIFETATRKKFRFDSAKGELTAEQLWDLPLVATSTSGAVKADLDSVARSINTELRSVTEESFVAIKAGTKQDTLEAKLEVVKHIIAVKLKEREDAKNASELAVRKNKLIEALASKEDEEMSKMSKDDIIKQLQQLGVRT